MRYGVLSLSQPAYTADISVSGPRGGVILPRSAWKAKILTFYGNLKVRVLGGVINVEAYAMKPSEEYELCIPEDKSQTAIAMEAVDPSVYVEKFVDYLRPFQSTNIHFHSKDSSHTTCSAARKDCCVTLDLGEDDVTSLNGLGAEWADVIAVALFKPLRNQLTEFLPLYRLGPKNVQQLEGFSKARVEESVCIPSYYKKIAWGLITYPDVSVLICGECGTGKSTLGRYLINYLLNRHPAVAYLECDPGQCEFTCPEVLSLHVLTEPVFGPTYTHLRTPLKGYYFGEKSPKADPEYYIRLLQSLYEHFTSSVRPCSPHIPLIINTCGWLYDMGVKLFLDLLRSLRPTHVVRLLLKRRYREDTLKVLPPLTEEFLTSTPGLFTPADRKSDASPSPIPTSGCSSLAHGHVDPFPGVGDVRTMKEWEGSGEKGEESSRESGGVTECLSSDMEMYGSSEEEFSLSESSGKEEEGGASIITDKEKKVRMKRKRKRKRLHLTNAKIKIKCAGRDPLEDRWTRVPVVMNWEKVLSYRVKCVESPRTLSKNSIQQRHLGMVSSFSPLLTVAQDVAKQLRLPDPHGNMLTYTPPLAVPWADVAIHILHKTVATEHMLYAFNGNFVCLGHVQPDQITEFSPGMFKLLKLHTPLIEFVGIGLLRAIDPVKKHFYLTTPLRGDGLRKVNVFVLGNPDKINLKAMTANPLTSSSSKPQCVPYQTKNFKPIELGGFFWATTPGRS